MPKIWLDLNQSRLPFVPPIPTIGELIGQACTVKMDASKRGKLVQYLKSEKAHDFKPALENIDRLGQPDSVVVVANFYPGVLGGTIAQLLKCLTVIKLCSELTRQGLSAVPLCWISAAYPPDFNCHSITLLDRRSELHKLTLQNSGVGASKALDALPYREISELLSRIQILAEESFDVESIEMLKRLFTSEETFSSASAGLIAGLLSEWGMVVLNADTPKFNEIKAEAHASMLARTDGADALLRRQKSLLAEAGYTGKHSKPNVLSFCTQNSLLPILACVLEPMEVFSCCLAFGFLGEAGLRSPAIWPQSSLTITNTRNRRILKRYGLDLQELYRGEEEVAMQILKAIPDSATGLFNDLASKVDIHLRELEPLAQNQHKFAKASASSRERMLYQLDKLRKQYSQARKRRKQTVERQIHKACNLLAPNRRLQEWELAGIQIPLRYSPSGLRFLYEQMDIHSFEHQLISMD